MRAGDYRARDGSALFLTTGKHWRQRAHAVAEPDPLQQFGDFLAVVVLVASRHTQRQRHVLVGRHVVEEAKILEHDANSPPEVGEQILIERDNIAVKQGDETARRLQRQEQELQERGLAGAGRPGEELERVRLDAKGKVAQDFRAKPIPQSDVFKPHHPNRPETTRNRYRIRYRSVRRRSTDREAQ